MSGEDFAMTGAQRERRALLLGQDEARPVDRVGLSAATDGGPLCGA